MDTPETSRFVRLRVELVLEITESEALTSAALERVEEDDSVPEAERMHAESAVKEDGAEALAYLIDPFDLVGEVPGVELAQASWSSESVEYDPDAEFEFDADDEGDDWDELDVEDEEGEVDEEDEEGEEGEEG